MEFDINSETIQIEKNGKIIDCDVLFTFDSEDTMKNYIGYTDHSFGKNGRKNIFVSAYNHSFFQQTENTVLPFLIVCTTSKFSSSITKSAHFPTEIIPFSVSPTDLAGVYVAIFIAFSSGIPIL